MKNRTPKVLLTKEAEKQLRVWTQAAEGEYSCFGVTELDADSGAIIVQKFFLPVQTCTEVHTAPHREAMGALMTELVREGYSMENLRCWAHSHADMDCFWSSEDTDSIEEMCNDDWLLSIVVNKTAHFRARLDLYQPWRVTVDKIWVGFLASIERDKELEAELKEKVISDTNPFHDSLYDSFHHWPKRRARADFGTDYFDGAEDMDGMNSPTDMEDFDGINDIFADLQLAGLHPEQTEELLNKVESWTGGDLEEFRGMLDDVLDGEDTGVDAWSLLQIFADYGCFQYGFAEEKD